MPARLTPGNVATPIPLVVADPTSAPFTWKATALPARPAEFASSVAESVVVPP